MTFKIDQIRSKLSLRFPDVEQVDESVIRFERKAGSRPFAVCYVDVSTHIPSTLAALDAYQEKVVARRYFDGTKSLQWSNYLYFIVETQPSQETKAVVERDRKYARKFILTEPELDIALAPPSFQVSEAAAKSDILNTWLALLTASNLDRAILNDESLPRRLDRIEASFSQAAMPVPAASASPRQSKQPFLRQIELRTFRDHPIKRTFELGTVTLICGANGTGKTSLLESIELVYCGRTKRNINVTNDYSINATFDGQKSEVANHRRAASLFRERNLAWYGQAEVRRDTLCHSFSRFNFLNTDAAVGLAEGKDDFEEDLSKLLVGPETSKTWNEIERTADKLADKIKELDAIRQQAELQLGSVKRQLDSSGEMKQESGAVLKKLDKMLTKVRWRRQDGEDVESVNQLVEALSEFDAFIKQVTSCNWVGAPVTIAKLQRFVQDSTDRINTCDGLVKQLDDARVSERRLTKELASIQRHLAELTELSKHYAAGLPKLLAELDNLSPLIAKHLRVLAGFNEVQMQPCILQAAELTVVEFVNTNALNLLTANRNLDIAKKRYSEFCSLRDESVNLAQRLREVASRILEKSPEPDICPLCHTPFSTGELATHIHIGVDQQLDDKASTLLAAIREQESFVELETTTQAVAKWAEIASQRLGQPADITVSNLMTSIANIQQECNHFVQRQAQLRDELTKLQTTGIAADRYRQLLTKVSATFEHSSADQLETECSRLIEQSDLKIVELEGSKTTVLQAQQTAEELLGTLPSDVGAVDAALNNLKVRVATTLSLLDAIKSYTDSLPWSAEEPLSDLAIAIGSIRQLAGDFQSTIFKERSAVTVLVEATKQKDQLEKQLAGLVPRIERFSDAQAVLSKIQNEYSLNGAMEEALRQNRTAIEGIFSRIHSPAEFSGLGDSLTTLKRKNGGTATLQQISTGQRAAFALSLFLAQNAQLRSAPPIVLIDDPIAHVDDLNCLSFLDYIRELVVAGDRQIVFATANDKLAMLFERKFDFLGKEEFRRYDLSR